MDKDNRQPYLRNWSGYSRFTCIWCSRLTDEHFWVVVRAAATGGAAQRIGECRVTLPIMIVKEKTEERERYVAGQRLQRAKKKIATSIICAMTTTSDATTSYAMSYQANWFSTRHSRLSLISLTLHIDHLKQLGNLLQPISFSHDSRPLAVSDYDWSKKIPWAFFWPW